MRKIPGSAPEAEDLSCLQWFEASFSSWLQRGPDLRQQLVTSLGTMDFAEAYDAWIKTEVRGNPSPPDLRQEREALIKALSAAGKITISPAQFYDIAHDVEFFRVLPERYRAREAIRKGKDLTERLRTSVQSLRETIETVQPPTPGLYDEGGQQRVVIMGHLQGLLAESVLGHALKDTYSSGEPSDVIGWGLGDLEQVLDRYLQQWDDIYNVRPGRPPNRAVHDLLHHLSELYEAMGGQLTATWADAEHYPRSPFAKFLTLIYVALPSNVRDDASENPSGFIARAGEVLASRKQGAGASAGLHRLLPSVHTNP